MNEWIQKFHQNFIEGDRFLFLLKGLGNTLIIAAFAVLLGIVLGFLVAIIRASYDREGKFKFLNAICKIYITVIRGTPVLVQLLILYYIIMSSMNNKILTAVLAFGLNSAAYVSEIMRSGIMSIDVGQFEAGRSLGLSYSAVMRHIILPQAVKNVLPALANEFIVLLKETSVSGYIGLMDLTRGGDIIRSTTYEAILPLLAVAAIYLVIVMCLSYAVGVLERRLRTSER
ncbi:amino acid ABC transporter permease [Clostridia bacterium]|nr:amino acid ABC transporter permease [Clostridia bacterium]